MRCPNLFKFCPFNFIIFYLKIILIVFKIIPKSKNKERCFWQYLAVSDTARPQYLILPDRQNSDNSIVEKTQIVFIPPLSYFQGFKPMLFLIKNSLTNFLQNFFFKTRHLIPGKLEFLNFKCFFQ